MPSIACDIITNGSGITTPNKARKYTKGLTQLMKSTTKIRLLFQLADFFSPHHKKLPQIS